MSGTFTGRHMAMIMVAFFAVVVGINLVMARYATATFGGTVVDNSYVASQKYNIWLERARADRALGWTLALAREPKDRLRAVLTDGAHAMRDATITATARHPLGRLPARALHFRSGAPGEYLSTEPLPPGRWIVHIEVRAQGRTARRIGDIS